MRLLSFVFLFLLSSLSAHAGMMGIIGLTKIPSGSPGWVTDSSGCSVPETTSTMPNVEPSVNPTLCTFNQPVPWADNLYILRTDLPFKINMVVCDLVACTRAGSGTYVYTNSSYYFTQDKTIGAQNPNFGGTSAHYNLGYHTTLCYIIEDPGKATVGGPASTGPWCPDVTPLPPNPPTASCTLNDGNNLDVSLGTLERDTLPTVPGTGKNKHYQIPVECKNADQVMMNMQVTYTPITIGGSDVISSSANGLGVYVTYNNSTISPSDVIPVTFTSGSNILDLAFGAVRDPNVETKNIPTGTFSASAVLVLTML